MSADESLSAGQFMSMGDLGKLKSTIGGGTVDQNLPKLRAYEEKQAPMYMAGLRERMSEQGQREPVIVHNGALKDGHHRMLVAQDLGWEGLRAHASGRQAESEAGE